MFDKIADALMPVIFVLLFASLVFVLIKILVSRWGKEKKKETGTKARAKILFKSVDEYDGTNFTNLTSYHVTNYFLDCLIDGKTMTFNCCEYMYNYVQKGETYDVTYRSHIIELDRKYYPDNFDDYFVDGSDDYDNDDDDYDDYESEE